MHDVDIHVGKRIRITRKLQGISQERLAEHLGLTFQQVQKYERGSNRVSASKLYDIACMLRVPVSHFFEGLPSTVLLGQKSTETNEIINAAMEVLIEVPSIGKMLKLTSEQRGAIGVLIDSML